MKDIVIALDMGNSGGKVIAAAMENGKIEILDERTIANELVRINGGDYWDIFRIFRELKAAMKEFSGLGRVVGIGVDGTSGAYTYVNKNGHPAGYVANSRDGRYAGWEKVITPRIGLKALYDETGVFPMSGNCISKVACDVAAGDLTEGMPYTFVQLSALMEYLLTGRISIERSMAGASVMMDREFRDWNRPLLQKLGIPTDILPPIAQPGTFGGKLLPDVARETGCPDCRYIHTVEFDSSTAMISAPDFDQDEIYLSMGTTINPGVEAPRPVINDMAYEFLYKNVPVWEGSYMLLSDVPGFFLVAECLKAWNAAGMNLGHGDLVRLAAEARTDAFLNLFDPRLRTSCEDMPERIRTFCRESGQAVPETVGEIARVMYESYAVTLAWSMDKLCKITGREDYRDVAAINGGARNALLCQMIADASGRPLRAGNPHATALGNILVQFYALGKIGSLREMRAVAATLAPMTAYTPRENPHLKQGLQRILQNGWITY